MNKILLVSIFMVSFAGLAHADYTGKWCVGEDANKCPATPKYGCPQDGGPGDVAVAKPICTVHTSNGDQVYNYRIKVLSSEGGGKCGYTVYEVTCLTGSQ